MEHPYLVSYTMFTRKGDWKDREMIVRAEDGQQAGRRCQEQLLAKREILVVKVNETTR